jgi:hypothetical protein
VPLSSDPADGYRWTQEPACALQAHLPDGPCAESDESNPRLTRGIFRWNFPTTVLYAFIISMRATYSTHLHLRHQSVSKSSPSPRHFGASSHSSLKMTALVLHPYKTIKTVIICVDEDCLCGLVVRIPGYRSRGLGSIPGATTFSEKYWVWNGVHSASSVQLRSCLEEILAAPV